MEGNVPKTSRLREIFFWKFNVTENFGKFVENIHVDELTDCIYVWEYVILNFESLGKE